MRGLLDNWMKKQRKQEENSCSSGFARPVAVNPEIQKSNSKEGSALIMVLAVAVVLSLLVAEFGLGLKGELSAASGHFEGALNYQLARSAMAMARMELNRKGTQIYADDYGDAYFIAGAEDYETAIEELQPYREGYELGRGMFSYQIIFKTDPIDPNELDSGDWNRLLEVACDMEEGDERTALVDAVLDWIDTDNLELATGAEEEFYQDLDPPRHCKNAPLDSFEELLLVHGFTPEMLYGYGNPVRSEDGMLVGGGLLRYFIGDNSPDAVASAEYVRRGTIPSENRDEPDEYDNEFRKVEERPEILYLLAQGFVPDAAALEEEEGRTGRLDDDETEPTFVSRHIMMLRLKWFEQNGGAYRIDDMRENIGGEMLERILAYGVPEEDGGFVN